jgi:hypothetical protein
MRMRKREGVVWIVAEGVVERIDSAQARLQSRRLAGFVTRW